MPMTVAGQSTSGAPGRNRTGMPLIQEATDFKSAVSTDFTTGANTINIQADMAPSTAIVATVRRSKYTHNKIGTMDGNSR